jgi:hypothetical protein
MKDLVKHLNKDLKKPTINNSILNYEIIKRLGFGASGSVDLIYSSH